MKKNSVEALMLGLLVWLLLLSVLLFGCYPSLPPPPYAQPEAPDPRRLLDDDTDAPSLYKVHQRYFEPDWL